jgi:23S rRNA (adenine2030-N6)-methyltransferase
MNYRHAFHAGNFADVHKHAVFARVIMHLRGKSAAFRILDTHAGAGRYDLSGPEAARTLEWRDGIGRLLTSPLPDDLRHLLAPYLDAVEEVRAGQSAMIYPGSPLLARALLRPQDRLIACEKEPAAARELSAALAGDPRAKALEIDGWMALSAYLPPKERRGFVLIDSPFEQADELTRLPDRLAAAHRKWATGIYAVWYPIKDPAQTAALAAAIARSGISRVLRSELRVRPGRDDGRLNGSGLILINPPWRLPAELGVLVPALASLLAREGNGEALLDWIAGEP